MLLIVCIPVIALLPLHAPDAVQEVALLELQLRVVDPPGDTDAGFALIVTVGCGAEAITLTVAVAFAVPPEPMQVIV